MAHNSVGWFEIYIQDLARARAFYETVFAVKLDEMPAPGAGTMLTFPMSPDGSGAGGALFKLDGVASGGGGTMVYFTCDDCAIEAGRVAVAGGRVKQDKLSIGKYGFIAIVLDTEGNMIGLHSRG